MRLPGRIGASPTYVVDMLPGLLVLGLSAPFVFVSGSVLAHQCTRPADSGLASGVLGAAQWLGGSLGVAAVSALLAAFGDGTNGGISVGFGLCASLRCRRRGARDPCHSQPAVRLSPRLTHAERTCACAAPP